MRISDWSSDVCSSDLHAGAGRLGHALLGHHQPHPVGARVVLVEPAPPGVTVGHDQLVSGLCRSHRRKVGDDLVYEMARTAAVTPAPRTITTIRGALRQAAITRSEAHQLNSRHSCA